jgi:hypothetical protein
MKATEYLNSEFSLHSRSVVSSEIVGSFQQSAEEIVNLDQLGRAVRQRSCRVERLMQELAMSPPHLVVTHGADVEVPSHSRTLSLVGEREWGGSLDERSVRTIQQLESLPDQSISTIFCQEGRGWLGAS